MKGVDKIIERVREELEKDKRDNRRLVDSFFNLLFWKDYGGNHVDINYKSNIFKEIEEATKMENYDGEESLRLDTEKILPFINKIRKQLGMLELTNKLFGGGNLMERTPEVDKQLILKELSP